jgi:hypothetical protein
MHKPERLVWQVLEMRQEPQQELARIVHAQHGMPTSRSAGMLPS